MLKLFSVAGIALIIIQSFQEFKYQLDNIVRSIATAIDGLISMLPGVSDFSFFQDVYKDSAAEDYLQGLAAQGEAFKDVQAKSQGLKDRIRALREDTNASAESFKDLTKQINKLENDGEKGLAAVARGMQKTLQTNVKATAGAADLVREIESLRNMKGEGADSAATERLVELEAALKNIGDIVPEVKDLLAEGLSGTALADALFKLEQEAQGANRSITDFNDGLTVLEAAFTSGNINQIATSFFNAKKRLVELNKNVDPDQAAAFTKEFAALAKDFGGVEALEKRLESSVDKQKEFIARDAALSVQQASTAQIANKFAKERATREDDLRAKALSIEKINQKILDTEIEMAQLGGEQDAEKQRLLDQLHAQLGAETGILNLTKERKTFLDSVSQIQEKISDLGREEKILSFRQNINKEL